MEWNKAYQSDNLHFLQELKDDGRCFDLIVTDPPYNIGKDFGNLSDQQHIREYIRFIDERINLCSDLLKPGGSMIWFCSYIYVGDVQLVLRKYLSQKRLLIWRYENGARRQKHEPVSEFEPFWWFSKTESAVYNIDDLRIPYKHDYYKKKAYYTSKTTGERKRWKPHPMGRKRGDVWDIPALTGNSAQKERTPHPTQKPIRLFVDIIKGFCPKDDGVFKGDLLDPFIGSGTLGAACEQMNNDGANLRWIGCDLEEAWVKLSNQRAYEQRRKASLEINFDNIGEKDG